MGNNFSNKLGIGLIPVNNNPSTAQLILLGKPQVSTPPRGSEPIQLSLPFKGDVKASAFCNDCEYFIKVKKPNKNNFNTRCTAETPRPGGSFRVVKLNVYPNEKVQKPFWCPLIKQCVDRDIQSGFNGLNLPALPSKSSCHVDVGAQRRRDIWLGMSGITAWDDIVVGKAYHMPPTFRRGRMNILIKSKYKESLEAENLDTNNIVWLYKQEEEYKFLSEIK